MGNNPIRILLVDDDEGVYIITRNLLSEIKQGGFELSWASTYSAALEALARHDHDVYLLDYRFDDHEGLELLRQVVGRGKALLVLLPGQGDHLLELEAAKAGAADYLIKGQIEAPLLEQSIRHAIWQARTLETLRESEEQFRRLVELSPEGIGIYKEDRLVYINPAGLKLLGATRAEELLGRSILNYLSPESHANFKEHIQQIQEQQPEVGPSRLKIIRLDGHIINVEIRATPMTYQDQPAIQIILRDITRALAQEEQYREAQKMEAVGRLAAGIAHDFNNLLATIVGFAGLLQLQLAQDGPDLELVDKILQASQRAADLVRQLLTFSRNQVADPRVIDLNTIIMGMERMLQQVLGENIQLATRLSPELCLIKIDPAQLEQVIVNLALNARDAMPDGGQLLIETAPVVLDEQPPLPPLSLPPGPYALLAISDTGAGINTEVKTHIFEPFFTTKEMGKGTGLGLATAFVIIKQSGGEIQVDSEEGGGSRFKIYLPCSPPPSSLT